MDWDRRKEKSEIERNQGGNKIRNGLGSEKGKIRNGLESEKGKIRDRTESGREQNYLYLSSALKDCVKGTSVTL